MNSDNLNKWLTLAANLAVLASIGFLALEIRQNTEMTRAQITQSRAEASVNLLETFFNSDYIPPIREKIEKGDDLSFQERARYLGWLRAVLRNLDNNFQQYQQGLLDEHVAQSNTEAIRSLVYAHPISRVFWDEVKHTFSDEFVEYADSQIEEWEQSDRE